MVLVDASDEQQSFRSLGMATEFDDKKQFRKDCYFPTPGVTQSTGGLIFNEKKTSEVFDHAHSPKILLHGDGIN